MTARHDGDPALDERILIVAGALTDAEIPFAFGGALALAYYGEPRATIDVDVNVFVRPAEADSVLGAVRPLGVEPADDVAEVVMARGQVRLRWDRYPLDLFFSTDAFHDACERRVRRVPFGDSEIPILSGEDLVVFKLLFNRAKDWIDIEQVLFAQAGRFDIGYVETWVSDLVGRNDGRWEKLQRAVRNARG